MDKNNRESGVEILGRNLEAFENIMENETFAPFASFKYVMFQKRSEVLVWKIWVHQSIIMNLSTADNRSTLRMSEISGSSR